MSYEGDKRLIKNKVRIYLIENIDDENVKSDICQLTLFTDMPIITYSIYKYKDRKSNKAIQKLLPYQPSHFRLMDTILIAGIITSENYKNYSKR